MSFTNKTPNYELPQYVANDKPSYLQDFNGAMSDIDTAMKANETAAAAAQSTADTAAADLVTLSGTVSSQGTAIGNLDTLASTTAAGLTSVQQTIGEGSPSTTAQTLIGAINELDDEIGSGSLDTTAQTLVGAVNEVNGKVTVSTHKITHTGDTDLPITFELDVRKENGLLCFRLISHSSSGLSANQTYTLATLPADYRPTMPVAFPLAVNDDTGYGFATSNYIAQILSNGTVTLSTGSAISSTTTTYANGGAIGW